MLLKLPADLRQDHLQTLHCLNCRKTFQRPPAGRPPKFCSARCRKAWSRLQAGFVTLPARAVSKCHETQKILEQFQQAGRAKIGVDGRPRTAAERTAIRLFCDGVAKEAVAAANRTNARYWRETEPPAAEQARQRLFRRAGMAGSHQPRRRQELRHAIPEIGDHHRRSVDPRRSGDSHGSLDPRLSQTQDQGGAVVKHNACLEAALRELDAAGIRDVTRSCGSKHLQLRWSANGHGLRMYSMALTPSDWRGPHNVAADIRRMLREDGLLAVGPPKPPKPPDRITRLETRVAALESALRAISSPAKHTEE
jgi:hypothetical protein